MYSLLSACAFAALIGAQFAAVVAVHTLNRAERTGRAALAVDHPGPCAAGPECRIDAI